MNLLKQADQALYSAKQNGRNRIALWGGGSLLKAGKVHEMNTKEKHLPENTRNKCSENSCDSSNTPV